MSQQKTKNDIAWEKLFDQYAILERVEAEGTYSILASDINKEREARLMTKFDHKINLPQIFKQNKLSILSESRRSYRIGRLDCYKELPGLDHSVIEGLPSPDSIESIAATDLYSESSALLCAQHAGMINNALGDDLKLTVLGRMTTGKFEFSIAAFSKDSPISLRMKVDNAQLEIDGGYEGNSLFSIIEAKNQSVEDFHIRQLYYPYRLWLSKLNKIVVPVFFIYSNEIFSFYVYHFADPHHYNSLQLTRQKHYRIVPTQIEVAHIRQILEQSKPIPEPRSVPFPQADRFERVIDLLVQLYSKGPLTQEDITTNYAFDLRQTQYYTNAGHYLGLVTSVYSAEQGPCYSLTDLGFKIIRKEPRLRNRALIELILNRKVFCDAMHYCLAHVRLPESHEIIQLMQEADLSIKGETLTRRAQTVRGWIRWIMSLTEKRGIQLDIFSDYASSL